MKTKAVILLLPFVMFIIEAISFSLHAKCTYKNTGCMKMMCDMKCSHQTNNCSKSSGKADNSYPGNCSNKLACSFCPMFALFVMQPQYVLAQKYKLLQNQYTSLENSYISSYISDAWKPPNNYLYS